MARKAPQEEAKQGAPEWMVTFSDLITLLMTFFVLLYSMSSIETSKFESVASSLRSSFNVFDGSGMLGQNAGDAMFSITNKTNAVEDAMAQLTERGSREYAKELEGTVAELRERISALSAELEAFTGTADDADSADGADGDKNGEADGGEAIPGESDKKPVELTDEEIMQLEIRAARQKKLENFMVEILEETDKLGIGGYVSIVSEEERLVVRLNSQILFGSGSAALGAQGRMVMLALGDSFRDLDHLIEVQGHTDNIPIKTSQFPSNWELSTQRATNVVRILQDECGVPPARLRSTGFGEYQPIDDNSTPEGRQNNRRIDIVITTI